MATPSTPEKEKILMEKLMEKLADTDNPFCELINCYLMAKKTKELTNLSAFAGEASEADLAEKDKGTQRQSSEGAAMNPSQEVEMTSKPSSSGENQEATASMTDSLTGIEPKKRLSGAQKKKLVKERKIAEGTWIEKPKPGTGEKRPANWTDQGKAEKALTSVKTTVLLEGNPEKRLTEEQAFDQELLLTEKIGMNGEVEMTSKPSSSVESQEATASMTDSLTRIEPKKRLSGAQKKKLMKERKIAEGTWVEKPKATTGEKRPANQTDQGKAEKAAKREGPGGFTYRSTLTSVKMAVLIEGHPIKRLTEEQAYDLELLLTEKIGRNEEGFAPKFLSCKLENGALIVNCADQGSSKWLEQTISDISPWQGAKTLGGWGKETCQYHQDNCKTAENLQ